MRQKHKSSLLDRLFLNSRRSMSRSLHRFEEVQILSQIDIEALKLANFEGIILDLDNTIVSEDDRYLSPNAEEWIERAKQQGFKFYILSNGKRRYRVEYWSQRLNIPAFCPARKPFRLGFNKAFFHMELTARQVIVIGDSLHTDLIGAWLSGCQSIQVASLPHPPRWWERIAGQWVQKNYPKRLEIWHFESDYS